MKTLKNFLKMLYFEMYVRKLSPDEAKALAADYQRYSM